MNWVKISRVFLAIMFIFSAVSKMLSLPFFDGLVAELLLGPDYYNQPDGLFYTQLLTRFLIAAELVLGVAILLEWKIKKIVAPAILAVLILFTAHLFYEGFRSPKGFIEGNCGCFGDILPMNNLESILKNVVGMIAAFWVIRGYKQDERPFPAWTTTVILGVVTLATLGATVKSYQTEATSEVIENDTSLTVVQPTDSSQISDTTVEMEDSQPDATQSTHQTSEPVSSNPTPNQPVKPSQPKLDPTLKMLSALPELSDGSKLSFEGKKLVCMFSMTCGHCQEIYKTICQAKSDPNWPSIALINFGKDFEQQYFFNQAGGCKHPHLRTEDYVQFNKWLEGEGFPRILAIENNKIVKSWDIDSYTEEGLFQFYGIPKKEESSGGIKLQGSGEGLNLQGKNPWD